MNVIPDLIGNPVSEDYIERCNENGKRSLFGALSWRADAPMFRIGLDESAKPAVKSEGPER